jgi:hypothetical protein
LKIHNQEDVMGYESVETGVSGTATARAAVINIPNRWFFEASMSHTSSPTTLNQIEICDNYSTSTTMRSCGARGQNINRAVPLGIPTKLQVNSKQGVGLETIQGTRNYQQLPRNNQELAKNQGDQVETSWRAQIRK